MIDTDFKKITYQDISKMSLLILQSGATNYCTAARDWSDVIQECHKNTYKLNYSNLYDSLGLKGFKEYLQNFVNQHNINVIYFDSPVEQTLDIRFLEELRKQILMVVVLDDTALFFNDWFRYMCQAFDLILSHDYVEKYRFALYGHKSLYFPQISDLKEFYELDVNIDNKDIEISFVGRTDRIGRKEFIEFLEEKNINLEFYGEGTRNGLISAKEKKNIYRRSKIALNFAGCAEYFHDKSVKKIDKRIKQVKGRIWELALCKTLIITDYAPCLEKSFNIGEEIVVFEDKYDLLEKIKFYQKNKDIRKEIALKGYQRAKRDCNPQEVCNNLLQVIYKYAKEKKYRASEIILDDDYLKSVSMHRAVCAVRFLKQKKYRFGLEEFKLILYSKKINIAEIFWAVFKEIFRPIAKNNYIFRKVITMIRGKFK